MISLDTNVIVRHLVSDIPSQAQGARALLRTLSPERPGFICREVVLETVWVLQRTYGYSRDQIATAIEELSESAEIVIETNDDVMDALSVYRRGGVDFGDLLILAAARRAHALPLYTFDRRLSRIEGAERVPEK